MPLFPLSLATRLMRFGGIASIVALTWLAASPSLRAEPTNAPVAPSITPEKPKEKAKTKKEEAKTKKEEAKAKKEEAKAKAAAKAKADPASPTAAAAAAKPKAGAAPAAVTTPPKALVRYRSTPGYPVRLPDDIRGREPNAVILPQDKVLVEGDDYLVSAENITGAAPDVIYVQRLGDWIESPNPVHAADEPPLVDDAMQLRALQGSVQVASPQQPSLFIHAKEGMIVPNGSRVQTEAGGSVAVMMGGSNSIRLVPDTLVEVRQELKDQKRSTQVDLQTGAVFVKIGKPAGVTQDFRVKTIYGTACARGTDFITVRLPTRMDVWVAEGSVELLDAVGQSVGTVSSEGKDALKIIRTPVLTDPQAQFDANSLTMTAAFDVIPQLNRKINALRDAMKTGVTLSPEEVTFLQSVRQAPYLVKAVRIVGDPQGNPATRIRRAGTTTTRVVPMISPAPRKGPTIP